MKIQIYGINYAPEMISTAVYTTGLAEALVENGHEVDVITAVPYYPAWKVLDGWSKWRSKVETPRPGLHVHHCPLYVPAKPSGLKRILHHASFAVSAFLPGLIRALRRRPDVVMVVAPSMMSAIAAVPAAKLVGAKRWLHIQDFEVEAAFATGLLQDGGSVGRLAKRFERWVLRRFDKVSSISQPMLGKLTEKGVAPERIYELRNWADLTKVQPGPVDMEFRKELGLGTKYVALYSGNIANKQGLEILPEVANLLRDRTDLTFAVCGDGPMLGELKRRAADNERIKFFPLQPRDRLGALLRCADMHLLPQIANAADLVLPSKLTNMLASGRPVLATADPDTALAHEIGDAGLVTPPGDATAFATALRSLLDAPGLRAEMGHRAAQIAQDNWSQTRVTKGALEQLETLVSPVALPTPPRKAPTKNMEPLI